MKFSLSFRPTRAFLLLMYLIALPALAGGRPYLNRACDIKFPDYDNQTFEVVDVSPYYMEGLADNYPDIKTVNAAELFKPGTVFLGFGLPNVFTAKVTDQKTLKKFDVKSLKRAPSAVIENDKGICQSGFFIVLKNVPAEAIAKVAKEAKARVGREHATCAQGNYELLTAAGFSIVSVDQHALYYFPRTLFESIIKNGILYQGQKVDFDIVKTTPIGLSEYMGKISEATRNTFIRHYNKSHIPEEYKRKAAEVKQQAASENERLRAEHPVLVSSGRVFAIRTSRPSEMGRIGRKVWGAHPVFEITISGLNKPHARDFLPNPLIAFAQKAPGCFARMKRTVLTPNNVSRINSNMAPTFSDPRLVDESEIASILTEHTEENPNIFNFVVTDDHMMIAKTTVRFSMLDNLFSKHAVLSNFAQNVLFAGELYKKKGIIYINRNSGTYKPTIDQLIAAWRLAKDLFPGLNIKVGGVPKNGIEREFHEPSIKEENRAEVLETKEEAFAGEAYDEADYPLPVIEEGV